MDPTPDEGLNWTKVGLKVNSATVHGVEPNGLNWTKVGLKGRLSGALWPSQSPFELD